METVLALPQLLNVQPVGTKSNEHQNAPGLAALQMLLNNQAALGLATLAPQAAFLFSRQKYPNTEPQTEIISIQELNQCRMLH